MMSIRHIFESNNGSLPVGKHNTIDDSEFDQEQLKMGIQIEFEHTNDPDIAKAIAKDHLVECADYYTRLNKMEAECEEERKSKI